MTLDRDDNSCYGSDSSDHDTDTNGDSNVVDSPNTNYADASMEVRQAFKGDDRGVFLWRTVVKVIMIAIAITLTVLTYVQLSNSERNDFEASFKMYSSTVLSYADFELRVLAKSVGALSDSMTSKGMDDAITAGKQTWPYVTIQADKFGAFAKHLPSISRNVIVWVTPIVDDITAWNGHTSNGSDKLTGSNMFTYGVPGVDGKVLVNGTGPFAPIRQLFPEPTIVPSINGTILNYDINSEPNIKTVTKSVTIQRGPILSRVLPLTFVRDSYPDLVDANEMLSILTKPIYDTFDDTATVVGHVHSLVEWNIFFADFEGADGTQVVCVVENTCGDQFTVLINGNTSIFLGSGDHHETRYDGIETMSLLQFKKDVPETNADVCIYTLTVYPTIEFRQSYNMNVALYTAVVGITMAMMVASFFAYDRFVQRRNMKVIKSAVRSSAIVASMFPSTVRDRLYKEQDDIEKNQKQHENLKTFLRTSGGSAQGQIDSNTSSKPLADLFAETTVLFADIAGFTAWSSVREPTQVFILLETLYAAFDAIAKRRRIFKVETIGDCYVAVSGLPEPRADHALVMSKFATDILRTMRKLARDLEITLGPDTGDLTLRIGLHSGPVTAGVLRGERARFQLFGDTMNTAARMEQTGTKNKIQVSQATANYLIASGKSHWLRLREDKVIAKGKGELITYWLDVKSSSNDSKSSTSSGSGDETSGNSTTENEHSMKSTNVISTKVERLIDWNTDTLCRLLQQIMDSRHDSISSTTEIDRGDDNDFKIGVPRTTTPFDEVKEIIALPQVQKSRHYSDVIIPVPTIVSEQLRDYVSHIACMYNGNHFHNFEHASHVTMSVTKLLSRIVAPSDVLDDYRDRANKDLATTLHDHTYGIASDPLTQFACVFSALIHDVDHAGVPNPQLVTEDSELAKKYNSKSVAEQNSIDLSWDLLMKNEYAELRNAICATKSEFARFRQLVVNAVMATDLLDQELKSIRNIRWEKAFAATTFDEEGNETVAPMIPLSPQEKLDQVNCKATVVIERLIQASDVSHMMQHWHIYRKWNELFYLECYDAYKKGRSTIDPSDTWYQGELDFYDYYIIPLAKKLKDCGVFGVSSTEYLQYATNNRSEWQTRGKEIVIEMKERVMKESSKNKNKNQNCDGNATSLFEL